MDLEPYAELVRSIIIQELSAGTWVELIRIPIENPEQAKPEDIQDTIEAIHGMIYRADKLELSVQGMQICIRNLDQSGRTFRVCAAKYAYPKTEQTRPEPIY